MSRVHIHTEQFDGHPHPWCGRGTTAVTAPVFEATDPRLRCRLCEREWFPNGQPDWNLKQAQRDASITAYYTDRANGAHAALAK